MNVYRKFATSLRNLARTSDDPKIFMPCVELAEKYEAQADTEEMLIIIQQQRQWVENHG